MLKLMGNTSSSQSNRATASQQATPSGEAPSRASSRRSRSLHQPAPPSQADRGSPSRPSDAQAQHAESVPVQQKRLPHRSLRTKKKSLELPDLALALTPAPPGMPSGTGTVAGAAGPYRRPQASSPIAIPSRPGVAGGPGTPSRANMESVMLKSIPSAAVNAAYQNMPPMEEVIAQPGGQRGRGNPHIRGGPLQYTSTRSFTGTGRGQTMPSFVLRSHPYGGFIPEDVHSSIPLAIRKAEAGVDEEMERVEERGHRSASRPSTDEKQPTQVCIVWRGGGKNVLLMRAGDNNWKGRQPMQYDEASKEWTTWVPLMPGTHHIRFLVDGISTIADDLPTAVDDNGSLANYVAVPISGHTPPSATLHPTPREQSPPASSGNGASFFADADTAAGVGEAAWTDKVPWQLECAAEEEEQWLAHPHSHSQGQPPPPQHPQAPSLPRHLEKLILNQKPATTRSSSKTTGSSAALFGPSGTLPVTTASGTNLSATPSGHGNAGEVNTSVPEPYTKLGAAPAGVLAGTGNADDGSVLPVPSHVVLHHLGTSAIRNGVLAVADTIRYKKKYITTIYYKPT